MNIQVDDCSCTWYKLEHKSLSISRSLRDVNNGRKGADIGIVPCQSVLNALNLDVTGLLAIGGVGGVAISFGAQRVMGNLVSGLLLFITQPFKVRGICGTCCLEGSKYKFVHE